jgi:hypothetical protein
VEETFTRHTPHATRYTPLTRKYIDIHTPHTRKYIHIYIYIYIHIHIHIYTYTHIYTYYRYTTAQHSTAQHSTAQHRTAQHRKLTLTHTLTHSLTHSLTLEECLRQEVAASLWLPQAQRAVRRARQHRAVVRIRQRSDAPCSQPHNTEELLTHSLTHMYCTCMKLCNHNTCMYTAE